MTSWAVLVAQIERLYRSSTVHKTFLALWRDFAVLPAATHLAGMVTLSCVSRSNQRLSPARQHIHLSLPPPILSFLSVSPLFHGTTGPISDARERDLSLSKRDKSMEVLPV